MNWKHWLSVGGATFCGGAVGYMQTHLSTGIPTGEQQVRAFAIGAALAGAIALSHLFQTRPGDEGKIAPDAVTAAANAVKS